MNIYTFWNNKGGTGKTSLAFEIICRYAQLHPIEKILAIDLCPQANLSELFLGGLIGEGSVKLSSLQGMQPRCTVGGYFLGRLPNPFNSFGINTSLYLSVPTNYNLNIPNNIDLLAGDSIVELQSNAMATLANAQIPGVNTWLCVIDWIRDFIYATENQYDKIFIDTNPSFSIYTQMAIAASNYLVLPVTADDSSRRAILNVLSLIYGINVPQGIVTFFEQWNSSGRPFPKIHLVIKNRITQYMGAASAYSSVLYSIDQIVSQVVQTCSPSICTFSQLANGVVEVRDFQTTGVVSLATGMPFYLLQSGTYDILGHQTQLRQDYIQNNLQAIDNLASHF